MIKFIQKILYKNFKKYNYYEKDVLHEIGQFYLTLELEDPNNNISSDCYELAIKKLKELEITHIKISGNTLTIYLGRPGILIGKKGENIYKLERYLMAVTNIEKIELFEDSLYCHLFPVEY